MGPQTIPVLIVTACVLLTIGIGLYGTRLSRTTSDFYVAGRGVNAFWNSSAISGEYLSAASFMGIAGMVMKYGYDALWYPVAYAAGFLVLLLFIAGPLRRFGAYTIPDFAEGRFDSKAMRKLAVAFALCISFFYMMPQMKGAGITLAQLLGSPYWVGVVVVGAVIAVNVILGGMKGITLVQAFQYWVKQFAIMVPIFILMAVMGTGYGANVANAGKLNVKKGGTPVPLLTEDVTKNWPAAGEVTFTSDGVIVVKKGVAAKLTPAPTKADPNPSAVPIKLAAGQEFAGKRGEKLVFADSVEATLKAGTTIPNVAAGDKWLHPFGPLSAKYGDDYSLLYTYSLVIALLCGTAGLPHILVRFYTNPDGREAKKTTLMVIGFLSLFYIFPAMWGAMGRNFIPSLYINGGTDLVTIRLPAVIMESLGQPVIGQILSGITSAGAFAAFMTTFSGLLVSVSGGFAHDIYGRILRPNAGSESRLMAFKVAAAFSAVIAIGLGLLVENFDINMLVGWAFAIGASTCFPLLLLGAWFKNFTKAGAIAGMLGGGAGAIGSVVFTMLVDRGIAATPTPLVGTLTSQPAIWTVPVALVLMILVSMATKSMVPADARLKMLQLHAPEQLGLKADYIKGGGRDMTSRLDNTAKNLKDDEIAVVTYDVKRILLPADGSATAIEAANVAMGIAKRFGAEVVACFVDSCRVDEPIEEDMIEQTEGVHHSIAGLRVAAEAATKNGVSLKTVVAEGAVAHAILATCEEEGCDMIVIGNTGRTGMQRMMLGSVDEAVVREAQVPVLVIKRCSTRFSMAARTDA